MQAYVLYRDRGTLKYSVTDKLYYPCNCVDAQYPVKRIFLRNMLVDLLPAVVHAVHQHHNTSLHIIIYTVKPTLIVRS